MGLKVNKWLQKWGYVKFSATISFVPRLLKISMYKKLNKFDGGGINGELDIIAEKQRDQVIGYCESCGLFLVPSEGRIQKYDTNEQKLLCQDCYDLVAEKMLSHV